MLAEPSGRPPRVSARVDAILGDPFAPRSFSLIAIHKYGLRDEFRTEAIVEAKHVAKQKLGEEREDLTHLPIVAIDPEDARDHDDAIWASPREDGDGWDAIVAIADVSYYVRPGSELDREARARGNSVYFPDRVVPMLPHELSSDICSLKQDEVRAAMACHLHVGKDGALKSWRFSRAKICVAANIAYENAQAAMDAAGEEVIENASSPCSMPPLDGPVPSELVDKALKPLWACWRALLAARNKREPLELDLPERRVMLDEKGRILSVAPRERLDAHRLVEDFMIAANVAAAKALEQKKAPVMYRVHEAPGREKLVALKDYLATFDIEFALGQVDPPGDLQPHHRADRRRIMTRGTRSWSRCSAPRCRRAMRPSRSAISGWRWPATPISPRRSAATPTCWSIARWSARYKLGDGRPAAGRRRAVRRDRRAYLDARAARDGGRARDDRPLCRRLPRRQGRADPPLPDHRRPAVRLLRHGRGSGRRRAGPGGDPRQ